MAIITTNDKNYKNIAKAIRECSLSKDTYTPEEMPVGIRQVYEKGESDGWIKGYGEGHTDGFDSGEENFRRLFWEHYQEDGARTDYNLAFAGEGWTTDTFWPTHNITVTNGYLMFGYGAFSGSLKERLAACKVQLTFSGDGMLLGLFNCASRITELGVLDFSAVAASKDHTHIFAQCESLQTIEKLILPPGQTTWNAWFSGCSSLENLQIEGVIVSSGMSFEDSPKLTRESMLSVMNALANRTGVSGTWKVTFGATNLAKLTEADKAIATNKGWTLA